MSEYPGDLAGTLTLEVSDQHADFFTRNVVVYRVVQDLGLQRYAALTYVARSVMGDAEMQRALTDQLLDKLRPWTRPDRNPFPVMHPSPTLKRLADFADRVRGSAIRSLTPRRKDAV